MNQVKQLIKETKKYLTKYDYNKVIELCDKILEIEPESSFGLRFNAIAHSKNGDYTKGLEYYNILYGLCPDEDTKYSISYLNEKLGNYEKALEFYDKNGEEQWIQRKRKQLLTHMKCFQTIIAEYDEKLENLNDSDNTPENIQEKIVYLEEKAVFQYRNNDYDKALESFKNSLKLYQSIESKLSSYYNDIFQNWYNFLQKHMEENPSANDFFREFFNFNNHSKVWTDKLNKIYHKNTDPTVYPDLLLELNQNNIQLLSLCAARYKTIDYDYSLDCWYKILEIEPENTEAIENILEIYSKQYSKDKSLNLINQKLYIEDIHHDLLFRKIRLLESMTLYDEALIAYDEYLSIDLGNDYINNPLDVFDKIRCMEQKALDYYLDKNLDESYKVLKEVSRTFNNTSDSGKLPPLESELNDWYDNLLAQSINQSNNSPKIFFEKFFTVNESTLEAWIRKIRFLNYPDRLGNPITYCNILLKKNRDNIQLLLTKAYIYYSTNRLNEALDIYNHILKLEDNNEAKNYKFNIMVQHHQYIKAYGMLKSMKAEYKIVYNNLHILAKRLLKNRKHEESLYVYETIFTESHSIDIVDKIKFLLIKTNETEKLHNCKYYMKWIDVINHKYESDNCPYCGNELTPIIYGYPTPESMERADKGEIILGGCCVSYDNPTHYCKGCQKNVNMDTFKIDITCEDSGLELYARMKIYWITGYILQHPMNTVKDIENEALKIGMDYQELRKFIDKLEEINHIKVDKNVLKLIDDVKKLYRI